MATLWELCRGRKKQLRRWPQTPLPQQVAPTMAQHLQPWPQAQSVVHSSGCSSGHVLGTMPPDFSIFKHCDPTSSLLYKQSTLGFHPRQKPDFGPGQSDLSWRAGLPIKEGQRSFLGIYCNFSQVPLRPQTGAAHLGWGNTRAKHPHPTQG